MPKQVFEQLAASAGGSDYLRLQDGQSVQLRIVSDPIWGREQFHEGRPYRWRINEDRPSELPSNGERAKNFVAFVVYVYGVGGGLKIWQFSQRNVIDQLEMIYQNDSDPWSMYVLTLRRKGSAKDTQYLLTPRVATLEAPLMQFAGVVGQYVDLTALFCGDSPFLQQLPIIHLTPGSEPVAAPAAPASNDSPF